MRTILHIKSATTDALAEEIISTLLAEGQQRVEIVDLNGDEPDYQSTLEQLFKADSVAVW
jgi:hypothetical protein